MSCRDSRDQARNIVAADLIRRQGMQDESALRIWKNRVRGIRNFENALQIAAHPPVRRSMVYLGNHGRNGAMMEVETHLIELLAELERSHMARISMARLCAARRMAQGKFTKLVTKIDDLRRKLHEAEKEE